MLWGPLWFEQSLSFSIVIEMGTLIHLGSFIWVSVCEHMHAYMYIFVHVWRPEASARCSALSFSTHFFEAGSLIELEVGWWPANPSESSPCTPTVLELQMCSLVSLLYGCGGPKHCSSCLGSKTSYPLSHLFSQTQVFFKKFDYKYSCILFENSLWFRLIAWKCWT